MPRHALQEKGVDTAISCLYREISRIEMLAKELQVARAAADHSGADVSDSSPHGNVAAANGTEGAPQAGNWHTMFQRSADPSPAPPLARRRRATGRCRGDAGAH